MADEIRISRAGKELNILNNVFATKFSYENLENFLAVLPSCRQGILLLHSLPCLLVSVVSVFMHSCYAWRVSADAVDSIVTSQNKYFCCSKQHYQF